MFLSQSGARFRTRSRKTGRKTEFIVLIISRLSSGLETNDPVMSGEGEMKRQSTTEVKDGSSGR